MSASGAKKTAIVTGASSGLGLYTAKALVDRGDYFVVMACRNVAKGQEAAKQLGFAADSYEVMELEPATSPTSATSSRSSAAKVRQVAQAPSATPPSTTPTP